MNDVYVYCHEKRMGTIVRYTVFQAEEVETPGNPYHAIPGSSFVQVLRLSDDGKNRPDCHQHMWDEEESTIYEWNDTIAIFKGGTYSDLLEMYAEMVTI